MRLRPALRHARVADALLALALLAVCGGCVPKARPPAVAPLGPPAQTEPTVASATVPATPTAPAKSTSSTLTLPAGGPIALTFDDGPDPTWTPQVLAVLNANHIKATFFEVGKQVRANPKIARMVLAAGMVIGNHTEGHLDLRKANAAVVTAQIKGAEADIQSATGEHATYFRFPFGAVTPRVRTIATGLGLKVVEWDVDTRDWQKPSPNWMVRHVIDLVHPGDVILMHDGGGDRSRTVAALKAIISRLSGRGYRFVTLDQLHK